MWAITITLFLICLALWVSWRKKILNTFKDLNIPGPEPGFFFGNFWDIVHKGQMTCFTEWIERYGRVFGYYYGLSPVLVVADPEMLRIIQQKEFQNFANRPKLFDVGSSSSDYNKYNVLAAEGKRWKHLRSIITPTFTVSKLKMMNPIMNQAVDELLEAIEKEFETGKPFNIYKLYQNLTMDVIARTSLGVHAEAQKQGNSPFVKLARILLSFELGYFNMFASSFPEITPIFSLLRRSIMMLSNEGKHPRGELQTRTQLVIKARLSDPSVRKKDLLQLLIDARSNSETVKDSLLTMADNDDGEINGNVKKDLSTKEEKLSDMEILQNAVLFLLAGYETTSTALAFTTHLLSHHQDIQDKLREEIQSVISEGEDVTYEKVQKLQCLNGVFNESLRIYPPITYVVNRKGAEDFTVNNIRIPKNLCVQVPVYNLHHDPTLWKEPQKFDPDRWTPEEKANIHPMAFQAFGAGPRNCVGMRFALMEGKLALAKLLNTYRILPLPGTTVNDLETSYTIATYRPKNGVIVQLQKI